ncbi:MAG TPA: HD domain-containing protein [Flavobacteriaceae bacterium]|nr:HD domain-containing protein [Flavobacteriaceae bacterium]
MWQMVHIGGVIAEELGADVKTVKMAALFHDMCFIDNILQKYEKGI